jgi:hypothetical protein
MTRSMAREVAQEERTVSDIEHDIDSAFIQFMEAGGDCDDTARQKLDRLLDAIQKRIEKLRTPNQNYFSGYIAAHFRSRGMMR